LIMLLVLIAYATTTHFLGTHLWGCFIAGMSFACIDHPDQKGHTHHVWVRQTKRYTSWMIRIFFACTVAFSIPIGELLSIESFWKGSIMGIGPCVLTKVLCAPCMGKAKFVVGWAMVGRAEFAYLIAQMAAAGNMIDSKTFSICIWALLYATILAPFIFRVVLNKYIKSEGIEVGPVVKFDDEDVFVSRSESNKANVQSKQLDESPVAQIGKAAKDLEDHMDEIEKIKAANAAKAAGLKVAGDAKPTASQDEMAEEPSAQQWHTSAGRFWWGRPAAQTVAQSPNGFLCCLFFKKQSAPQ